MNENLIFFSVERSVHCMQTYSLVSSASFCMISRIMRHASEVPSGVAWMVKGFSVAPEFSFLWMSTRDGLGLLSDVLYGQALLSDDGTNKLGGDQDPQREINLSGLRRAPRGMALLPGRVVPTLGSLRGRRGAHLFIRDVGNLEGVVLKLMPA